MAKALRHLVNMQPLVILPDYNQRENLPKPVLQLPGVTDVRVLGVDEASPDQPGMLADRRTRQSSGRVSVMHGVGLRGLEPDMPADDTRPGIWIEAMPWWVLPLIAMLTIQSLVLIVGPIAGWW